MSPAGRWAAAVPVGNAFRTSSSWCTGRTVMDWRLGIGPRGVHRKCVPWGNTTPGLAVGNDSFAVGYGRAGSSVAEHGTFNPLVEGSNPSRLTRSHAQTRLWEAFGRPPKGRLTATLTATAVHPGATEWRWWTDPDNCDAYREAIPRQERIAKKAANALRS